jgi:hypothetical protein
MRGTMSSIQPAPVDRQLPRGHLLVLNRSLRRTLEAENKSPRTVEAYTDAVRFLASYCQAHGHPRVAREFEREHIQVFIADPLAVWSRPPPTTATGACTPSSSGPWPRVTWRPAPWVACDRPSCPSNQSTWSAPNSTRRSVLLQNQHLNQAGPGLRDDLRLLVLVRLEVGLFVAEGIDVGVARRLIVFFFHRLPPFARKAVDR